MELIIAVLIAVVGWGITHYLTIKAQKENFKKQLINNARIEIGKAIKDYQDWLIDVDNKIRTAGSFNLVYPDGASVNWTQKIFKLIELFHSDARALNWLFLLEDNEVLFPQTASCRIDLIKRHNQIKNCLSSFITELQQTALEEPRGFQQRDKVIEKANKDTEVLLDQLGLIMDLRVHLQNFCLTPFTGQKIPVRKPGDSSVPKIVRDKKGNLEIRSN